MKRHITSWVLLSLALTAGVPAYAGQPEEFVRSKQGELLSLLEKAKTTAEEQRADGIFDQILDYDTLAKETLADIATDRSPAELKEFNGLLKQLVRNAYRKNLKKIRGYVVEYQGETPVEGGTLVRTVAHSRQSAREEPLGIDYRLHQVGGKWLVSDIITEGSSLVNNYRNQFRRIIRKQSFDELLRRMRARLKKGDGD